ncbi:MAG: hypothetical protein KJO88_01465, partial [Gammaproteobacteria bacterium]|nr:hypothetical protein [Gammaproteobacteria bacterium]
MKVITNTFAVFLIALVVLACSEATSSSAKDVVIDKSTQAASDMVKVAMADADGETEEYKIDIKGAHASVLFKVNHLGYSWLHGRFNDFNGAFTY